MGASAAALSSRRDRPAASPKRRDGIPGVREEELAIVADIEDLLAKNAQLSALLTGALDQLVAAANTEIGVANQEAISVQRTSTAVLAIVVGLSLASSLLIVWLYVGRNLIARLTSLNQSMMAIAGGRLDADIPSGGGDEIGDMAETLNVFRDTALEAREADRALREAKQDLEVRVAERTKELRIALDHMPGGMLVLDKDLKVLIVNERYIELFEYPDGLVSPGKSVVDMLRFQVERGDLGEIDPDEIVARTNELFRSREPLRYQAHLPSGKVIEAHVAPAPGESGVAVALDITEQKTAQRQLRESEQTFKAVVDQLPVALALKDVDGRYTLANPMFHEWFAQEGRDVVGIKALDLYPKEIAAELADIDRRIKETGEPITQEIVEPFVDGSSHTMLMSKFPIRDPDGTVIAIGSVESDITERKRAEEALKQKTALVQMLHRLAISANDAEDPDEAMQICLDVVCEYTGWPIGHAYLASADDSDRLASSDIWHLDHPERFATFRDVTEKAEFAAGVGLPGRVLVGGEPAWIVDVTKDPNFPRAKLAEDIGVRSGFALPVLIGRDVRAVLEFFSDEVVDPDESLLQMLVSVGTQLGRVVERKEADEQ